MKLRTRKWKTTKTAFSMVMCLTLVLSMLIGMLMPLGAAAAELSELPDLDRKGSLSITFTFNGEPISDGNKVGLFKIADVVEDDGYKFKLVDDFASIGELPEDLDAENEALADKLSRIASEKGVTLYQASQELDANGNVVFKGLDLGLYLVVHTVKTEKTLPNKSRVMYTINPFVISIPQNNDGKLTYDIKTNPKVSPAKAVVPPPPPDVPQTGQLWWPVMVCGAVGVLFICAGLIRKNKVDKK